MGAKDVVDATTQDVEDDEGAVEGGVSVIGGGGVHQPTSPHPGEGVEHAWTTQAYQANETDLNQWGIVFENGFVGQPHH